MPGADRRRTLSVRWWFAFAAITTFVLVVVMVLAAVLVLGAAESDGQDRIGHAASVVRDGADRWDDDAWRASTAADLRADGVSFVLFEDATAVYRSDGPVAPGAAWDADRGDGIVRVVELEGAGSPRRAVLYGPLDGGSPVPGIVRATLVIGVVAALVSLAFGRPFVRSLRAVRHAARRVSEGDLVVSLPRSHISEVDDLNAAFETMTAELHRSLGQQAELEHERRLFIAAIAHDLRTPLFSLRGYLDGLEQGVADTPDKRARYLAIAGEKARSLDALVANLFDYARLEYLDEAPQRTPLDLAEVLHDLVESLRPQADGAGVTLELWPHDHACAIHADRDQLVRAATNLIDNAIRYTPAGGRVAVACGLDGDDVWFTVTDTGPGIDPADLPHLFQPLYRGDRTRASTGGAGLGLAVAHRIVTAHQGALRAGNAAAGGAEFTATLPARLASTDDAPAAT